jgi:hypothetical protein
LALPTSTKKRKSASLSPASRRSVRKSPSEVRRERADLAATQHEGVLRGALVVGNAELFEGPRGRAAGVQGVPAAVEEESVGLAVAARPPSWYAFSNTVTSRARPGQGSWPPSTPRFRHPTTATSVCAALDSGIVRSLLFRTDAFTPKDAAHPPTRDTERAPGGDAPVPTWFRAVCELLHARDGPWRDTYIRRPTSTA